MELNVVCRVLLIGTRDEGSPLSLLGGGLAKTVLPMIWAYVQAVYAKAVFVSSRRRFFKLIGTPQPALWPSPRGRHCLLLPFSKNESSLPDEWADYWPLIKECPFEGEIGYLTVDERVAQHRVGLNCQPPTLFREKGACHIHKQRWGSGPSADTIQGGLYIATNVDHTARLHDCSVTDESIIGPAGQIDHLRDYVLRMCGKRTPMKAHQIAWISGTTPVESLQQCEGGIYFQVVGGSIGEWNEEECTPNPEVKIPKNVRIVRKN
jgi:hypothetical protein